MFPIEDFRADLHCHSFFSDGTLSPQQLINEALNRGLSALSITDHDSIEAYPEVLNKAEEKGLSMITGVEFSAMMDGCSVHILGYSFSHQHPSIKNLCTKHSLRRTSRNQQILEQLAKLQMPISDAELKEVAKNSSTIGRPHIALAMVQKGYAESIQEAFRKFIGDGKKAFVAGNPISVEETLETIHEAKGLAVIAHPHLLKNWELFNKLLKLPFDGIECFYSQFPLAEQQKWEEIAKKNGLLISGGSDFHGATKPQTPLGCSYINERLFQPLLDRYKENR